MVGAIYDNYKHKGLHQYIWMVGHQAEIPDGYIVHHIDFNPLNNSIHNLVLLTIEEHNKLHNTGNKNWLGKKHTEETKKKMSESHKGKTIKRESKIVQMLDPITDKVLNEFELMRSYLYGFNVGNVCQCCIGNRRTHKGYKFKYKDENTI